MKTIVEKNEILQSIINIISKLSTVVASWEGGSAATKTSDQFSDIDLCLIAEGPAEYIFSAIESEIKNISPIIHTWTVSKSSFGDGLRQKFYVQKDTPKYFFIDLCIFNLKDEKLWKSFLEVERHGVPLIHFDKLNILKISNVDQNLLFKQQQARIEELKQSFPIYKTLTQKELERARALDAFNFYQNGLVKPIIEILGMIHRPFQYDFGFRYLERTVPKELAQTIKELAFVSNLDQISKNVDLIDRLFYESLNELEKKQGLLK